MKLGDRARVSNKSRGTFGQRGEIVYISPPCRGERFVVDVQFSDGTEFSYVEDEIEVIK